MKRAGRWLFTFAAAVSLIVCVAAAVAWVRSYWHQDILHYGRNRRIVSVQSFCGGIAFIYVSRLEGQTNLSDGLSLDTFPPDNASAASFSFFDWRPEHRIESSDFTMTRSFVFVSDWVLCAGGALLPVLWVVRARYHRRFGPGLCPCCGYDLRASPDRCPECGTIPVVKGATT